MISNIDKAKYEFPAPGIRMGSLVFGPAIALDETYDDNVYRTSKNQESDFITAIKPSLGISTDFDMHALYLRGSGSFGFFKDNESENYKDYNLGGGGRFDLDYDTFLTFGSNYKSAHEGRDSPDDPNAVEPVEYSLTTHQVGFTRARGLIKLYVEGIYNSFEFGDAKMANGARIDNSSRDRDIYTLNTKLAYEYFPGYHVYTAVRYDERTYDRRALVSRDSTGIEYLLGSDIELTGKVKADVYVGKLQREYDSSLRPEIDATSYGGQILWNMTGLTSLTATAERAVEETTYQDASGNLSTRLSLGLDHMLDHNLFLSAGVSHSMSDYEERTGGRKLEDQGYGANAGLEYMPFDGTSVKLGYSYSQRESDVAGEDYDSNRVTLSLTKRF